MDRMLGELALRLDALKRCSSSGAVDARGCTSFEERLGRVVHAVQPRVQLLTAVSEIAEKLRLLGERRRVDLVRPEAREPHPTSEDTKSSSGAALSRAEQQERERLEVRQWDALYAYTRDHYLRDLGVISALSASKTASADQALWRTVVPAIQQLTEVAPQLGTTTSTVPAAVAVAGSTSSSPSGGSVADKLFSNLAEIVQWDETFQVDGVTKHVDDVADLILSNRRRVDGLKARLAQVVQRYRNTVEWANRCLCRVDMELDVLEAHPLERDDDDGTG